MATTNIRWTVTKTLIDLIRAHPSVIGVQVEPGWPGDTEAEAIWVDELDGEVDMPLMMGGRKIRDDRFTIPFEIRVANRDDLDSTMERLLELVAAIEDVTADDPTLGGLDSMPSAVISHERQICARTPDGHIGFAEVVVDVHSRLH